MFTSKDVARLAGVSPATVSRVFRGEKVVTEATRERVLAVARQLNYTPSAAASILKKQNSHTVAFLDPDPCNPFYIRAISRISEALQSRYGYSTIMAPDTKYNREALEAARLFLSYQVECIVLSPILTQYNPQFAQLIQSAGHTRFLQLHARLYDEVSSISYEDAAAAENAVSYLLEQGHRRILFAIDDRPRMQGCRQAFIKAGIDKPEIPLDIMQMHVELDRVEQLIREYRPTAVMAVAEMSSLKAYAAITRLNLRIPEDISFLVYDDTIWAEALGITVVAHPMDEVVEEAVDQIVGMGSGQYTQPRHRQICPQLLTRGSVKNITGK